MPATQFDSLKINVDDNIRWRKARVAVLESDLQTIREMLTQSQTQQAELRTEIGEIESTLERFYRKLGELEAKKSDGSVPNLTIIFRTDVANAVGFLEGNTKKLQEPKYKELRGRIECLTANMRDLINNANDENNEQERLMEQYCMIVKAVSDALPNEQGQVDPKKIATLQAYAKEIKTYKHHFHVGLRSLAGIMLMIVGALTLLLTIIPAVQLQPIAIGGFVCGVSLIGLGYGLFKGTKKYPDTQNLAALADNLEASVNAVTS